MCVGDLGLIRALESLPIDDAARASRRPNPLEEIGAALAVNGTVVSRIEKPRHALRLRQKALQPGRVEDDRGDSDFHFDTEVESHSLPLSDRPCSVVIDHGSSYVELEAPLARARPRGSTSSNAALLSARSCPSPKVP
ncbi:hypothetical protein ACEE90_00940 [Corynebacterium phoceense]